MSAINLLFVFLCSVDTVVYISLMAFTWWRPWQNIAVSLAEKVLSQELGNLSSGLYSDINQLESFSLSEFLFPQVQIIDPNWALCNLEK